MEAWEIGLVLDWLGIVDEKQREDVVNTLIPVLTKAVTHINDNLPLFETLTADAKLVIPTAKIVLTALSAKLKRPS